MIDIVNTLSNEATNMILLVIICYYDEYYTIL
jgi:hypothetical protein